MSYADFFHALTPYNFMKHKKGSDKKYFKEKKEWVDKIMNIADVEGDGTISYFEFFFFVLVWETPSKHVSADFKAKGGVMNLEDFTASVAGHRKKTTFGKKHKFLKREEAEFTRVCKGMCERIFAGKKEVTFDEYMAFRNDLQEMLWHYEFAQFDTDTND